MDGIVDEPFAALRYQLLTATAGDIAAALAVGAARAVVVVHEFRSAVTSPARRVANARALDDFVSRLSGGATPHVDPGQLYLLPPLPGAPLFTAQPRLFLGKVSRHLPTPSGVGRPGVQ